MNPTASINVKLRALSGRGIMVTVSPSSTLQVRPASRLTAEECNWFREHAAAILAHLVGVSGKTPLARNTGSEPWDSQLAIKLMWDTDRLVEQSRIDGRHPAVVQAAAMVTSAFGARDMETIRYAVSEFRVLVRQLAFGRVTPETKKQST